MSKAGAIQLTKNAAFELGQYGINVNCVAPGAVDTDMLKGKLTDQQYRELINTKKTMSSLGILGKPEDIANTVLFLLAMNLVSSLGRFYWSMVGGEISFENKCALYPTRYYD